MSIYRLSLLSLICALACGGGEETTPAAKPAAAPAAKPAAAPAAPAAPAAAPATSNHPDWKTEATATGDLTGDGSPDTAKILSHEENGETKVTLELSFGDPNAKVIEAPDAVCAQCGGVKGMPIPFEIEINATSHVLSLTYTGGSREMTSRTTKWRQQNGQFEMIGVVETTMDTMAGEKGMISAITREANLSTFKMTEEVETVTGMANDTVQTSKETANCAVPAVPPPPTLTQYSESAYPTPHCSNKSVE